MFKPPPSPPGSPEWMVTYADLVSLLLAAFVMLVAVSQDRDQQRTKNHMRAFQQRFVRPSAEKGAAVDGMCRTVREGRGRRAQTLADAPRLALLDASEAPSCAPRGGETLRFGAGETNLHEEHKRVLDAAIHRGLNPTDTIDLNGTSRETIPADASYRTGWDLAYARCFGAMEYLVQQGVDPRRISIRVAATPWTRAGERKDAAQEEASVEVSVLR